MKHVFKKIIRFLAFIFLLATIVSGSTFAQGCSDAGACSIGSMDDSEVEEIELYRLKISFDQSVAAGEKFTFISQTAVSLDVRLFKNTSLVIRTPFIFTSGNLGNSTGVGDVLISLIQQLYQDNESQFGMLVAGKLRSNNSDFSFYDSPLPMAYQTSLGTYDIIAGLQYLWKAWDFYFAYQHPFGRNDNQYLNNPSETDENKIYFESAQLKRGDDLAFRVQKTFELKNNQNLMPGVMPIYRIQKSEIIKNDQNVILEGSNGLTLNLYLTYMKQLKGNTILYLTGAFPVVDRSYRADGLTRNFVISMKFTQLW